MAEPHFEEWPLTELHFEVVADLIFRHLTGDYADLCASRPLDIPTFDECLPAARKAIELCVPSRERSLAITHLEEVEILADLFQDSAAALVELRLCIGRTRRAQAIPAPDPGPLF